MNHSHNLDIEGQITNTPGSIELFFYDDYDKEYFPDGHKTAYQNKVAKTVEDRWKIKRRGREWIALTIEGLIEIWHTDDLSLPVKMWSWKRFGPLDLLVAMDSLALRELHLELIESELQWHALETEPFEHANLLLALDMAYAV